MAMRVPRTAAIPRMVVFMSTFFNEEIVTPMTLVVSQLATPSRVVAGLVSRVPCVNPTVKTVFAPIPTPYLRKNILMEIFARFGVVL
jgi:hypothetical protein